MVNTAEYSARGFSARGCTVSTKDADAAAGSPSLSNYFITEYFDWPRQVLKPGKRARFINRLLGVLGSASRLTPVPLTLMTTVEQRINLFHLATQVLAYNVPGDFVELGCNHGQSSVLFQKLIMRYDPSRELHVYDSFEGLPSPASADGEDPDFIEGAMKTTEDRLKANFKNHNLPEPVIHKGWFSDTLPAGVPDQVAFAYLDGDLYESILVSLRYIYPRLVKGAICVIDDYSNPEVYKEWTQLPGVKKACDEYLADKPEYVEQLYSGVCPHGYFRKL
jgi:O-methyltransferase